MHESSSALAARGCSWAGLPFNKSDLHFRVKQRGAVQHKLKAFIYFHLLTLGNPFLRSLPAPSVMPSWPFHTTPHLHNDFNRTYVRALI